MTLKEGTVGKRYRIEGIKGGGALKRRVMDMGLTKGSEIYLRKVAPLGDPIQISARNYELSLRKADAEIIEITEIEQEVNI